MLFVICLSIYDYCELSTESIVAIAQSIHDQVESRASPKQESSSKIGLVSFGLDSQ